VNREQVAPGLCKILKSEKLWNDMNIVVRAVFPCLILLRLADKAEAAMDKLYFYVRRMETCLQKSQENLNEVEAHYGISSSGGNVIKNMAKYFLGEEKDSADVENEFKYSRNDFDIESGDDSSVASDSSSSLNEEELESDADRDDASTETDNEIELENKDRLGNKMVALWNARKKKLIYDLSIAAWMVSPMPEIMEDVEKHDGEHRNAVERLIKKWYSSTVSKETAMLTS
jgi:hypothetical protein